MVVEEVEVLVQVVFVRLVLVLVQVGFLPLLVPLLSWLCGIYLR